MSKGRIALIMVGALVALAALTAPSASGARNCGGGVRAVVVDCTKAKGIAKEYSKTRNSSIQGYRCSSHRKGSSVNARCVLDNKRVLFSF